MLLQLKSGRSFLGTAFGAKTSVQGEVVFNTSLTGFVETLTDPSYLGQILVLTYPLQGNYGVPSGPFESSKIQIAGLVVSNHCSHPSHYQMRRSLSDWLNEQDVPAICGIDTRSLTQHLREFGTLFGSLSNEGVESFDTKIALAQDTVLNHIQEPSVTHYGSGEHTIMVIDTGAKENIFRSLVKRNVKVLRVHWRSAWENHLSKVDGIMLANGPGDPATAVELISRIRAILSSGLPIFGICLGNQLMALAAGATTTKMKYGHRSANQPVKDLATGKCYITSQNHGYVVKGSTLPQDWEPWFINLNDGTNEGIRHKKEPIYSVQFHPEASPGPNDTNYLFDYFVDDVRKSARSQKRKIYFAGVRHSIEALR